MNYVGLCFDSGAWDGDLTGLLVGEFPEGWAVAGSHISSSEGWARRDIQAHFDRRSEPATDDTYKWLGRMGTAAIANRFGRALEVSPPLAVNMINQAPVDASSDQLDPANHE